MDEQKVTIDSGPVAVNERVRTFKLWTNKCTTANVIKAIQAFCRNNSNNNNRREEDGTKKKHEKWFIDRWWCVPTDKDPKHNGFDYLSNALSAPLHPQQHRIGWFLFGSGLFLIGAANFTQLKRSKRFLFADAQAQGYQRAIHKTRWFINSEKGKKNQSENTWAPGETNKTNARNEKNQCTILGDGMLTNEPKRLILTVNIDTSDYLNVYATLEVQRPKWIDGYWGNTEIKHQKNRYTCSRWKCAHKT